LLLPYTAAEIEAASETSACSRMPTRDEFRNWERALGAGLCSFDAGQIAEVLAELGRAETSPDVSSLSEVCSSAGACSAAPQSWSPRSAEVLELLHRLRGDGLLPCICFHTSEEYRERLVLGIGEILEVREKTQLQETRCARKNVQQERQAAWQERCKKLRQVVVNLENEARGRLATQARKVASKLGGHRHQDDERAPEDREEVADLKSEAGQEPDVSGDRLVRAFRATLAELEEAGPPIGPLPAGTCSFVPDRPWHIYGTEIRMLLGRIEAGLKELGRRRGQLWAQTLTAALRRGVALHLEDEACEWINLAMLLLFRLGHLQVLVAGEALGIGTNLPCRTTVILDAQLLIGATLTQMAGRAGRRGLDLEGATVFVHDLTTLTLMKTAGGGG